MTKPALICLMFLSLLLSCDSPDMKSQNEKEQAAPAGKPVPKKDLEVAPFDMEVAQKFGPPQADSPPGEISGDGAEDATFPVLVINERLFDAGEVRQGAMIEHNFRVFNTGEAPLQVLNVRPG